MAKSGRGRKPIIRRLPGLKTTCAGFTGFKQGEPRMERLFEVLLIVIQQCRSGVPRPFYAMREVADYFDVSLATVSRVYRRLGREGVLTVVRSSQTVIPARVSLPRFAIRGVVCMPIWLPGFLHFLDWRKSFSNLEEELSGNRFVLEPIFYGHREEIDSAFVNRVLKFNPDYVFWDSPAHSDLMTMQGIMDAGVPILTVLRSRQKTLPGRIYRRSYSRGLRRGLKEWKASGGIDRIVVPQAGKEHRQDEILSVLQDCSLPHEFIIYDQPSSLTPYFKRLMAAGRTGIIFSDDLFYSQLCTLAPEKMIELFRRHRVMVLRQVTLPGLVMPAGVTVDSLLFSSKRLARRIAADLSQSKGTVPSTEEVFEAEWRPYTPLEDVVQINFNA